MACFPQIDHRSRQNFDVFVVVVYSKLFLINFLRFPFICFLLACDAVCVVSEVVRSSVSTLFLTKLLNDWSLVYNKKSLGISGAKVTSIIERQSPGIESDQNRSFFAEQEIDGLLVFGSFSSPPHHLQIFTCKFVDHFVGLF